MTTGQRIQQARKIVGLSQKQLGEKLGLSASMIGQWENDLRNPKYETVKRIAIALNVEPWELMGYDGSIRVNAPTAFNTELVAAAVDSAVRAQYPELYEYEDELNKIDSALSLLNADGRQEAVKRVEELTEIPRYCAQDGPEPGMPITDTPAPQNPAEGAPEGE